ncbi:serine carboxypeptidase-domain-containing protein [Zychaea mexicana]|uniref:serine carboxypeptidase-domain-containing protein n=1 Tax=Zychaea mexicana TaxID=64656 RepID=UPI0022FF0321|nr:serine carboxypeptidase-domain-containing protein [Zychaea mexicana]KAI9491365.1 serine carboxypeptidase-domain-containing protein [Zychaea mexicana]
MWKSTLGLLTTLVATVAAQTADTYKIDKLPGLEATEAEILSQYAGHIEIAPETHSNLFFWMIEQANEKNTEKLIIWLNGGPGCSSMDGLFLENGPYRINPDLTVNISSGGWQDHATVVYLDQPVGTGFSFADMNGYTKDMNQIVDGFMVFLEKFFDIFPHLKEQDMYLAGESYAGTYIPYFTTRILQDNKKAEDDIKYNIKGVAIGNGWISPEHQYDAYYDFAVANNLLHDNYKKLAETTLDKCHKALKEDGDNVAVHSDTCERVLTTIIDSSVYIEDNAKYCINQYDIRLTNEEYPSCGMAWPYELDDVTDYLRTPELVKAVHADKQSGGWTECASAVSRKLDDKNSKSAYGLLPGILEEIPVLLFSGDQDLICNILGTQYLISNMTWNGAKGFKTAVTQDWLIDEKSVGSYTEARNLTLVVINEGSHMVPYDKPIETLDMINRFMGVGDNQVNGVASRVGDSSVVKPQGDETNPPKDNDDDSSSSASAGEEEEDPWAQYYSWGTSALIVVLLFAGLLGYCWYRNRKNKQQHGYERRPSASSRGAPASSTTVFGGGFLGLFGKGKRNKRPKLRLDDQDDTNELDELVIETPTLFAAEDYSDDDHQHRSGATPETNNNDLSTNSNNNSSSNKQTRFAIAEDNDDDDFEDFADWDEESNIVVDNKGDKRH